MCGLLAMGGHRLRGADLVLAGKRSPTTMRDMRRAERVHSFFWRYGTPVAGDRQSH